MVFAHLFRLIERALLLLPSARKEDGDGGVTDEAAGPAPENMYDFDIALREKKKIALLTCGATEQRGC